MFLKLKDVTVTLNYSKKSILKQHAINRRLRPCSYVGMIPENNCEELLAEFHNLRSSFKQIGQERALTGVDDVGDGVLIGNVNWGPYDNIVDVYNGLKGFYDQKLLMNANLGIVFDDEISSTTKFAELHPDSSLPWHFDDPYYMRFIIVLEGEHNLYYENRKNEHIKKHMGSRQVWALNPSWKHKVENVTNKTRISLLGKYLNGTKSLYN